MSTINKPSFHARTTLINGKYFIEEDRRGEEKDRNNSVVFVLSLTPATYRSIC